MFKLPLISLALMTAELPAAIVPSRFDIEVPPASGPRLSWFGQSGRYYDLWASGDLSNWAPVDGYPRPGANLTMEQWFVRDTRGFFRMASGTAIEEFFLPEVAAYKAATGITSEAAHEINLFLRHLRGAGVEPVLFWLGGSRYKSINGTSVAPSSEGREP